MKDRFRLFAAAAIFLSIIALTPIVAAETGSGSTDDSSTSTSDSTDTKESEKRQKRIDDIKKELHLSLTENEKEHLKTKCKPAQSIVAKTHTRFGNSVTTRTQAYTELTKILNNLKTKLKDKGVDTAELEAEITELSTKITTYSTDLAAYKQKLSDLKSLDCQADPTAFEAALTDARTARDKLITDIKAIRTYVKDTIKPTLQKIRTSLESSSDTTTESSTDTNKETTTN